MGTSKESLINSLASALSEGINELGEKFQAVQILPELKKKYPTQLRSEILSVRMYQTDKACYLEISEDLNPAKPDNMQDEIMKGEYSNRDYKSERSSLSFISDGEKCFFTPTVPVLENAYLFLEDFDDESKLNCTNLFTKDGADEIYGRIKENRSYDTAEGEDRSGERIYVSEQLKRMEGYSSSDDPQAVETPFFYWCIEKGKCVFAMHESQKYTENNPFDNLTYCPEKVEYDSTRNGEDNIYYLKIPLENIERVYIKSEVDFSEPYKKLGDYGFSVDLLNGDMIEMSGYPVENPPEYWYYNHKVWTKKA